MIGCNITRKEMPRKVPFQVYRTGRWDVDCPNYIESKRRADCLTATNQNTEDSLQEGNSVLTCHAMLLNKHGYLLVTQKDQTYHCLCNISKINCLQPFHQVWT